MRTATVLAAAGEISVAMAAGPLAGNDRFARQTVAAGDNGYGYDVGQSPVPTPDPTRALWGRMPDLAGRAESLGANTCGIVTNGPSTFPITCASRPCQTNGNFMGCDKQPFTKCFLSSASQCKQSSLAPGVLCCTQTTNGWTPRCATFLKDDGRLDFRTRLACAHSSLSGTLTMTMIAATDEAAFFSSGGTVTATDPMPTGSSPSETSSPSSGGSSSNTGAIVGGVVGGVAVLAIAACVIVWLVMRKRRDARSKTPPPPGQESYLSPGQSHAPSSSPHYHYAGTEEQYKYQAVPPVYPPAPVIHEAPGDTQPNNSIPRAELEDRQVGR
ncbi:hypothetical protein CGLO_09306 [Colletotrichum gloeosporioides Cg-14]|uniref:Uncharacterized protein n=1 Tax=Colletotrichum gloeosporioides (strain Cg-14) TaxID=1237896 RepID=T0KE29_COLGC|nr:hypothetical protein CGLO_09306 [Colletotrichum gloeosporioides Cg-14]